MSGPRRARPGGLPRWCHSRESGIRCPEAPGDGCWIDLPVRRQLTALPAQSLLQGVKDELMHRLALAEAYLGLGRVDVDVDTFGRQCQEQGIGREALVIAIRN